MDDHDRSLTCAALAEGAGLELLALRQELHRSGLDPVVLKERGDARSQAWLARELSTRYPEDAVLSEEAADDLARLDADHVWIIDPLDGTREFSEAGRDDWAVHVALWHAGDLTAGAVALPARRTTYSTLSPPTLPGRGSGPLRLAVSRTRPPEFVTALADRLGAVLVPMGSAGVKAMSVLAGQADAYVHAGGQYEWDSAAPVAVARAAGLHVSRIDGSPLVYNNADPWLPDLAVCRPEIAPALLAALRSVVG